MIDSAWHSLRLRMRRSSKPFLLACLLKEIEDEHGKSINVYAAYGPALRRHPELVPRLLQASIASDENYSPVNFVSIVFENAGKEPFPGLHEALRSPERKICALAALICADCHDTFAIPYLLTALQRESSLTRNCIVFALTYLHAREAIPALTQLYISTRDAEQNHL